MENIDAKVKELRDEKGLIALKLVDLSDFLILNAKHDPKGEVKEVEYYRLLNISRGIDNEINALLDSAKKGASPIGKQLGYSKEELRAIHENEVCSTTYIRSRKNTSKRFDKYFGSRNLTL